MYVKWQKMKTVLWTAGQKQLIIYKENPLRLPADFSTETLQARMGWHDIYKVLNVKNFQPRVLYLASLSFRIEGKIEFPR